MQCLLIYRDSGSGKTMVLEKFLRDHPPSFDRPAGIADVPVVAVQMPAAPDERRLYAQLLPAVGAPSASDERLHRIEARCLRLLKTLCPQLIVVGEVHHLLAGNAREQHRALDLLTFLANDAPNSWTWTRACTRCTGRSAPGIWLLVRRSSRTSVAFPDRR